MLPEKGELSCIFPTSIQREHKCMSVKAGRGRGRENITPASTGSTDRDGKEFSWQKLEIVLSHSTNT